MRADNAAKLSRLTKAVFEALGKDAETLILNYVIPQNGKKYTCERTAAFARSVATSLSRLLQISTVLEDTEKCRLMARRYPWRNSTITRADHFYFVWLSFTMQCYLFRERTKVYLKDHNSFATALNVVPLDTNNILNQIKTAIGDEIRHRGQHTHEGHRDSDANFIYMLKELIVGYDTDNAHQTKLAYLHTKYEMENRIKEKNDLMFGLFQGLSEASFPFFNRAGAALMRISKTQE